MAIAKCGDSKPVSGVAHYFSSSWQTQRMLNDSTHSAPIVHGTYMKPRNSIVNLGLMRDNLGHPDTQQGWPTIL